MKVLSLFDGMNCGMIAFRQAGIPVEEYHAYETDKYAVATSKYNFPEIVHHGDVFDGNFTEYNGCDWLIGGSPCTYWSIAQNPEKRETVASGIGWDLFQQYVRALHEAEPEYFLYENNFSMSDSIRESISEVFGFEPIMINSALVSAQFRKRLYWVGKRNADGAYNGCYYPESKEPFYMPLFWMSDADKREYEKAFEVGHSACYTGYGMKRTGCAGCPFNSKFLRDIETLERYEPKLAKAVKNIFGKSYEYTLQYREFKSFMKAKKKQCEGQMTLFDD